MLLKERLCTSVFGVFVLFQAYSAVAQPSLGLPWRVGQIWQVMQEYHPSIRGSKSVDFDMYGGDDTSEIVATADGIAYAKSSSSTVNTRCAVNDPLYTWRLPLMYVEIDHGDGWKTTYLHLSGFASELAPNGSGVRVVKGQVIGYLGKSGCTYTGGGGDGSHLDFTLLYHGVAQPIPQFEGRVMSSSNNPSKVEDAPILEDYLRFDQYLSFNNGLVALAGDWNGDGKDEVGRCDRRTKTFSFFDSTGTASQRCDQQFGDSGDLPVVGDWNGDGKDTVGVYRPSEGRFYLSNNTSSCGNLGSANILPIQFGLANEVGVPIIGDWDNDRKDNVGLFRDSDPEAEGIARFHLGPDTDSPSFARTISFGAKGDLAVAGNWDGIGGDEIGIFRPYVDNNGDGKSDTNRFYLDFNLTGGNEAEGGMFELGIGGDTPIIGNWNGIAGDNLGVYRPTPSQFFPRTDFPPEPSGAPPPPPPPSPAQKANGELCATPSECQSGYCTPIPDGTKYCLHERKSCSKPDSDGLAIGERAWFDGKEYQCGLESTYYLAPQDDGRECRFDQECKSTFCSPTPWGESYCINERMSCARPNTPGIKINEEYYHTVTNKSYVCATGNLLVDKTQLSPSSASPGTIPTGYPCDPAYPQGCASSFCEIGPDKHYCVAREAHCAKPGEGGVKWDEHYLYQGKTYDCAPLYGIISRDANRDVPDGMLCLENSQPSDCASNYCYPGPRNRFYCINERKNCVQPGKPGVIDPLRNN